MASHSPNQHKWWGRVQRLSLCIYTDGESFVILFFSMQFPLGGPTRFINCCYCYMLCEFSWCKHFFFLSEIESRRLVIYQHNKSEMGSPFYSITLLYLIKTLYYLGCLKALTSLKLYIMIGNWWASQERKTYPRSSFFSGREIFIVTPGKEVQRRRLVQYL